MANSKGAGGPKTKRRARPIVYYLVVLALVAFVPVMAFAAVLLQRNNEAQQEIVQTLILTTTEAVGQAVDRQTDGTVTALKGFSSAPMASEEDLRQLYYRGQSVLAGTGTFLSLVDANLHFVFNTRLPIGTALGEAPNPEAIRRALDTGQTIISNVVYSLSAQSWVVPIYMPVNLPGRGKSVLAISQSASNLASILLTRQMPDGWRLALVDTQNNVIAASPNAGLQQGSAFFIPRAPEAEGQRRWRHVSRGDESYVTIDSTSTDTGWRVAAWAPAASVERPLSNSLLTLILGGLVIVATATLATFFLSREISRSVRGLARDARRLGSGEAVPARDYPISEIGEVAGAISQAAKQRQAAETEVRFLMRELAHRSKNQMTVIAAMAKQTARGAESVPEFVQSFEKRIFGLARSTDLLLANGIAGVDLEELLTSQIGPFCPLDGERVELDGPSVRLNTQAAQILGMAAHELATNAAKYGAFATDDGRLELAWRKTDDGLALVWRERVKALATRAERRGFGTTVLESMVGTSLAAEVERILHADGIEWRFVIPLASLDPSGRVEPGHGKPTP
ncbi:MAG TPA: sensor histidine kinase [Devosiaceae bacterium]|nr:sensor histidine kinase [Devosiaceae bacterium]